MNLDYFQQLKDLLGDKIEQLHISNGSISDILESEAANLIKKTYETEPLKLCSKACGQPIRSDLTPAGGRVKILSTQ